MHQSKTVTTFLICAFAFSAQARGICPSERIVVEGNPIASTRSIESFTFTDTVNARLNTDANGRVFTETPEQPPFANVRMRAQWPDGSCTFDIKDDDGFFLVTSAYMAMKDKVRAANAQGQTYFSVDENFVRAIRKGQEIMEKYNPPVPREEGMTDEAYNALVRNTRDQFRSHRFAIDEQIISLSNARNGRAPTLDLALLGEKLQEFAGYHYYTVTRTCDGSAPEQMDLNLDDLLAGEVSRNWELDPQEIPEGAPIVASRCVEERIPRRKVENTVTNYAASTFTFQPSRNTDTRQPTNAGARDGM